MSLESLRVYRTAHEVAELILSRSTNWDDRTMSSIGDQLVRSVVSITNNISEGYARTATGERVQLLMYAEGSASESRNAIKHAVSLGALSKDESQLAIKLLTDVSVGIIELAWSFARQDPSYRSPQRKQLEKRHNALIKSREERAATKKHSTS